MANKIKFATFFTKGTPYESIAKEYLLKSCEKLNLPLIIAETENCHSWQKNVAEKPSAILQLLRNNVAEDECLVFLDADCTIEKFPQLFFDIDEKYDIGFHRLEWSSWYGKKGSNVKELLSGTLFLRNRDNIKSLCEEWYRLAKKTNEWEQKILARLLTNYTLNIFELPCSYCFLNSRPHHQPPLVTCDEVFIRHYQMSRSLKHRLGGL